jgi:hypothetical protein
MDGPTIDWIGFERFVVAGIPGAPGNETITVRNNPGLVAGPWWMPEQVRRAAESAVRAWLDARTPREVCDSFAAWAERKACGARR